MLILRKKIKQRTKYVIFDNNWNPKKDFAYFIET